MMPDYWDTIEARNEILDIQLLGVLLLLRLEFARIACPVEF